MLLPAPWDPDAAHPDLFVAQQLEQCMVLVRQGLEPTAADEDHLLALYVICGILKYICGSDNQQVGKGFPT